MDAKEEIGARITALERQISDHEKRLSELEAPATHLDPVVPAVGLTPRPYLTRDDVLATVQQLEEKGGYAYAPDLVAVLMPRYGLEEIAKIIKQLRRDGEVFEARPGYLKAP